ncbi:MAG TPA: hypothetical protein VIX17_04820 [Pyrinomonadaceae bacterium]|jgi:hypothetical protein
MKRLAVSVVGGFALPFLYTIIIGPASLYIKSQTLNRFAEYPVRWPILILLHFASFDSLGSFPFRDQDATIMFVYIVVCDVVLYTVLTYFLLWVFSKRNRKGHESSPPAPHPPQFV